MYRGLRVCIIIPVFNEQDMIGFVLRTLPRFVDVVVVIDDGSTDSSYNNAIAYQSRFSQFLLRKHAKNMGFGAALKSCYITSLETRADVVVLVGGDGQMDPRDLPSLLDPIVDGSADIVSGDRFSSLRGARESMPRDRLSLNRLVTTITAVITGYRIADAECGYSAMNRRSVGTLDWADMSNGWGIGLERLIQLRKHEFLLTNVPVQAIYRRKISKLRYLPYLRDYVSVAFRLMPLWLQFPSKPARESQVRFQTNQS